MAWDPSFSKRRRLMDGSAPLTRTSLEAPMSGSEFAALARDSVRDQRVEALQRAAARSLRAARSRRAAVGDASQVVDARRKFLYFRLLQVDIAIDALLLEVGARLRGLVTDLLKALVTQQLKVVLAHSAQMLEVRYCSWEGICRM
eukprot:CAMPEP_0115852422 /NCGR_PEP_ID=MMETSP0287-20121206/12987_1 /TAXON_ID=412157 /ORGANISM="Chrysochromulina rotalis, Strain UIO044" /LENGTH=144 /DNA_ID=CAMNT_0003306481 /DNA_START=680 /DNA_END=1116 /DNA_ORIENTATION=-